MQLLVCLFLGLAASVEDLWRRRISNVTVLAGLASGFAIQIYMRGWLRGPLAWAAGAAVGFGIFLIFFLAGGMGGGDIKLMAAFGACLGTNRILRAALLAAIAGALLACAYLLYRWREGRGDEGTGGQRNGGTGRRETIPYAPAIFIGALLSLVD